MANWKEPKNDYKKEDQVVPEIFNTLAENERYLQEKKITTEQVQDAIVTSTQATSRTEIGGSETVKGFFGKVRKWFADLRALAFKGTVGTSDIDNSAVTTAKIASSAVTTAKINAKAVTDAKIDTVSASKVTGLHKVATSGDYNDLINKPSSGGGGGFNFKKYVFYAGEKPSGIEDGIYLASAIFTNAGSYSNTLSFGTIALNKNLDNGAFSNISSTIFDGEEMKVQLHASYYNGQYSFYVEQSDSEKGCPYRSFEGDGSFLIFLFKLSDLGTIGFEDEDSGSGSGGGGTWQTVYNDVYQFRGDEWSNSKSLYIAGLKKGEPVKFKCGGIKLMENYTNEERSCMKKVCKYLVIILSLIFSVSFAACSGGGKEDVVYDFTDVAYDSADDGTKKVTVASCDLIGAGGYGALYDVSIDPFNDSILATRCDMGGLYMSYNKGKSWERRNILGVMSDIDFDEENEGVMWATGSGVYKSTDHGKTFELIFPSKESIAGHGSGGESMGECIYTKDFAENPANVDYEPASSVSTMVINRKSGGKNIFVAQKVDWPIIGGSQYTRIFKTENGKDFTKFIDLPYTSCIKLEYDEVNNYLVVVTENSVAEYNQEGQKVWSANFNLSTMVNGIIAFDSYYDKESGKNTFAFCELADEKNNVDNSCYFTDDLQDRSHYQDLIDLLSQKKLMDIKDEVDEGQEDYAANEYYYWLSETQFFEWRITNVHIARENVFYFYHTCTDRLVVDGKETGGEVYINAYLQYKDGNFKWIYGNGVSHAGVEDLSNESWVDWASFGPAFSFASSRQNEDMVAVSTIGTVYVTEDCKTFSQCHCTLGKNVEVTAKDGNGHEQKVSEVEWGIPIHESTTNGIDVQTTYKTVTDPFDKNHLLMACTDIGLIQSFNGGKTWIHSLLSWSGGKAEPMSSYYRNTCYDIIFDKERRGVVYGIWSGTHDAPYFPTTDFLKATGAFAVSYDGGTSWTMRSIRPNDNVLPYRMDIDYTEKGRTFYIATEGHGFFVTRDYGQTFTEMNAGIRVSTYLGKDNPAIFGNKIISCKAGIFAITGSSAWGMIPNPEDPDNPNNKIYERALYKWNKSLKRFEEIKLPPDIAAVRDIEYSEKEDCLYIGAVGTTKWLTSEKIGGGLYRYKDGEFTQIFDETKFVWGLGLNSQGVLYAVSFRGEIYRFTENNTKAELLIGKEDYVGELYHILKDISFGTDDIIYVSTFGGGMYRITLT